FNFQPEHANNRRGNSLLLNLLLNYLMASPATHLKNGNGKRERNPMEAEDSEFTPLSKRINNLHLYQSSGNSRKSSHPHHAFDHNQQEVIGDSRPSYSGGSSGGLPSDNQFDRSYQNHGDVGAGQSFHRYCQNSDVRESEDLQSINYARHNSHLVHVNGLNSEMQKYNNDYNPSLNSDANPHYYESNRQLYLLYLERMQRTGQALHPQFFSTNP
ncbi:unnamed protein product, partial [Allacma fusca]